MEKEIISGWNLSWGEGCSLPLTLYFWIISGWNLSWGEGNNFEPTTYITIISGWNLSWGEGCLVLVTYDRLNYIRLESELG